MLRPTATKVKVLPDYCLELTFDNGEIRIFDVKPHIQQGSWFGMLNNKAFFNTVKTNGFTIEWADGQDICPDELYYDSVPVSKN